MNKKKHIPCMVKNVTQTKSRITINADVSSRI